MFGRSSTPEVKPLEAPKPAQPAAAPNPFMQMSQPASTPAAAPGAGSPFSTASRMTSSVIGTDLTIVGEKITIISKHQLQIDGDVRGDVNGVAVVIGEEGSVIGTVSAETVEVRGGIKGAVRGKTVTLHSTADVEGDLLHENLAIMEGAKFDGRVRRAKDPSELTVTLDPSAIPGNVSTS